MIRVVIYDDNEQRRSSLEALLMLTGNLQFCGGFPDCRNVVEEMKQCQPDVVLMDIEMPFVDGISGVKEIKKHFPDIRVIMQTIFEDDDKIFAALQGGAEGYILKNATVDKVIQSIEEVHAGGAFMTPSVAMRVTRYFNKLQVKEADENQYRLTPKEKEVLTLLTAGKSYKMVADELGITYFTVNSHVKKIYEKLRVHSIGEALALAHREKLL